MDSSNQLKGEERDHAETTDFIFARNSPTELCEGHGMEIVIGKLSKKDLNTIAILVEGNSYLDSEYFNDWFIYDNVLHENGLYLNGQEVQELGDKNALSTHNFEFETSEESEVKLKDKGVYLCTFRNETIYFIAEKSLMGSTSKTVKCQITCYRFLQEMADLDISILKSATIDGENMERNSTSEEESGEIYGTHQFLIKDGEIIFYATTDKGQMPFYIDDSIFELNGETEGDVRSEIVHLLKSK